MNMPSARIDRDSYKLPPRGESELPSAEPLESPLASVEYDDTVAHDCAAELTALQKGFAERAKAEAKRFADTTDSEYWFAVCFQSREQKEAFLEALKWAQCGDKYLDGTKLAKLLDIDLPKASTRFVREKTDKRLSDMSAEL